MLTIVPETRKEVITALGSYDSDNQSHVNVIPAAIAMLEQDGVMIERLTQGVDEWRNAYHKLRASMKGNNNG